MEGFDYGSRRPDGQFERHPGLTEEEASQLPAVRPLHQTYVHAGCRPEGKTRELTEDERNRHREANYVCYEEYGPEKAPLVGRFWTQAQLTAGCQGRTTIPIHVARQYQVNPKSYGRTFCCHCRDYFPVEEFVWVNKDGTTSKDRVGS